MKSKKKNRGFLETQPNEYDDLLKSFYDSLRPWSDQGFRSEGEMKMQKNYLPVKQLYL